MSGQNNQRVSIFAHPWHFILFAVFPVLSLLAYNITEINSADALRFLFLAVLAANVLFLILISLVRDRHKAAALSALCLILFFSYGHIYHFAQSMQIAGVSPGRHRLLVPLFTLLFGWVAWRMIRSKRDFSLVTRTLNIIALSAAVLPLLQISFFFVREKAADPVQASQLPTLQVAQGQPLPDIYYIILDGYSRDDVLKDFFQYDNSSFIRQLTDMGFTVPRCSASNYAQTQLSLASALNMTYLDKLAEGFDESRTDRVGMPGLIKRSAVRQLLEELDYTTVAFETGYYWTQIEDAGVYLSPKSSAASLLDVTGGLNGFEALLIKNSGLLAVLDAQSAFTKSLQANLDNPDQIHRQRVLFSLDQLGKLPASQEPVFVFAHIVSPHKPFVFGPNGEAVVKVPDEKKAYTDQVAFLNSQIIPLLQKIISSSKTPPVIIIQGDHGGVGTSGAERMAILNAYYLPGEGKQILYDTITPVNSFRLILDEYFGAGYDKLDDSSYFSEYQTPYKLTPVPNNLRSCP